MWPVKDANERTHWSHDPGYRETAVFRQQATSMNQELLLSGLRLHELAEVTGKLNTQLQQEMTDRKRMEQALMTSAKLAATTRLASTDRLTRSTILWLRSPTSYSCSFHYKPAQRPKLTLLLSKIR